LVSITLCASISDQQTYLCSNHITARSIISQFAIVGCKGCPDKTASTYQGNWKTGNILNEPSIFPKFPQILPKVAHFGWNFEYILDVPLGNTSGTPFWFILNFTGWEHCDHIAGDIAKDTVNEPLRNIMGAFFGNIWNFPNNFLNQETPITWPGAL
jgi:hypothetical protein